MPNFRRAYVPGGSYFFTLVTAHRAPILCDARARACLRLAFRACRRRWPVRLDSYVILPDHLHAMWTLPIGDADFSLRWAFLKKEFTKAWLARGGTERPRSDAKRRAGRRGVWQRRFWEHLIRDEADYIRHMNYVHYNSVKHGLTRCPHEWPHSSFARYVRLGILAADWACQCGPDPHPVPDFAGLDKTVGE